MPQVTNLTPGRVIQRQYGKLALIAVGANMESPVGAPAVTLRQAIAMLAQNGALIRSVSRFFQTPCFPRDAGPDYVNAALTLQWNASADAILGLLHDVEASFARQRIMRWGQRTLDLDLIALGDEILPSRDIHDHWRSLSPELQAKEAPDRLILPHPRVQDRAFVLGPLRDIAPAWQHPIFGLSIAEMYETLSEQDKNSLTPL
ncbi:2-amino-4-hydroxy-6-hydroxymethyldihydropteridine diphosphokinase [Primorskyibacter sp. S187A]|uniref:2-amino-4-hydroxy-6- hydroxymethyldihydropteridine diphosphokinase n=1 Tax=Primorskyibacter sp. S187A TaxID=3415130 RepID=UPI003C7AAC9D